MTRTEPVAHTEQDREQAHVDRAYARLEQLRQRARDRAAEVLPQGRGGTHQARHDRDAMVRSSLYRLERLDDAEHGLVFGRLDERDGDVWRIGRMGVHDGEYEPLVVDWRAPVAAPFYRATPLEPCGLVRRRHIQMRARSVIRVDDELFDADAVDDGDLVLVGEGALLAAMDRPRGARMTDIVATIQREQDQIIRSPLEGVTVVQGGPGTGKTAVALHRAAYLLYAYRERIADLGVLVIGPTSRFLRYIGDVLPGLGEDAVRLARIDDLLGPDVVTSEDRAAIARLKGDARMAEVIARLVKRWPWQTLRSDDWDTVPETMLTALLTDPAITRSAATDVLSRREIDRLVAAAPTPDDDGIVAWTAADVALLDELLAATARRRPRRRRRGRDDTRLEETIDVLDIDDRMRATIREQLRRQTVVEEFDVDGTVGHVVVDEAQDLSPMQWRMLARRCPSGSMTVVGDLDQATGAAGIGAWDVLGRHVEGRVRTHELTINYRVPAEVMDYVVGQSPVTGARCTPPRSVRHSGHPPRIDRVAHPALPDHVRRTVDELATGTGAGTLAVVVAAATLADVLDGDAAVLSAVQAKGLEFDSVVVVDPQRIARDDGGAALYVALTRVTQRLVIVELSGGFADR